MNNGVSAALGLAITDLVIVGDLRLAIQQSLGVIACRKETLMAQLNHHRELVAKLRSVKYLHAIREFNAAADSLASETLESKTSAVTTFEAKIAELRALNRINEVIYEPSVDGTTEAKPSVSVLRASMTREGPRRKTFFNFVRTKDRDSGYVTVTTRHQAKTKMKRVRFANEVSVMGQDEAARLAESYAVPNEAQNVLEETLSPTEALTAAISAPPDAEDVDPLLVQEERRRRVAAAQDEELRWSNLRAILRGEDASLGYQAARDAWKMADRFVLSEDGVLYFGGTNRRSDPDEQQGTWMRLLVPSTMVQEVLQSCHDSL
ncbi:hypothetical protein PR003_g23568 [Phytophthora rubi]|uniref:RNase H type-1 domain-containing protein n=1 Tax=Phytophthora rubi TaxID=129364 RepID=A0A6A3K6F5_9STRA|nr:hypothetical protein PR002_g18884 [Phytophthora rubi]KAE9001932.1 hypothetical protein PR001_g18390 [Phytophthora rubi]KAE9297159.1 hypothetical protein PR003_g23568 [Phytophthora rubi]